METIFVLNSTSRSALADYAWPAEYLDFTINRPTVFHLVANILVFILGVPGNCLILRVYWTKTRKTSTHVLIMALAWADLAVCLLRIYVISAIALNLAGHMITWRGQQVLVILSAFGDTAVVVSFLVTAIIAADRYDCVCRPHRRFFTPIRGKIAACSAVLFAIVANMPGYSLKFTSYSLNLTLLSFALMSVSFLTALVTIAVCYGKVYAAIRKHVKVGDVPEATVRDEGGMRLVDTRSTRAMPHRAVLTTSEANRSVDGKIVSTITIQPSTSLSTHTNSERRKSSAPSHDLFPDVAGQSGLPQKPKPAIRNSTQAESDQRAVSVDRNHRQERVNGTGRAPQRIGGAVLQRKTTRMLFSTSVVFLLTWLPAMIYSLAVFASLDDVTGIINDLRVTLLINNAVNPLIYGLANRRFRKDCWEAVNKIKFCQKS